MFLRFFETLRVANVPVSMREFLSFLEGMKRGLVTYDVDGFYYLARTAMVKDERHLDRFDRAFAASFEGLENISLDDVLEAVDIPADWLEKMAEKHLSPEEKAEIEALGG
ncbi:MAG: VWA domain-containing protein, partial [Marinosulfonomonas sp.]|nr:VWA domain-containing protein [Marinosulfonomonas sp.]